MVKMHGGLPIDQYENDAFIGYHGSWNRDTPTGYKVVYIPYMEALYVVTRFTPHK